MKATLLTQLAHEYELIAEKIAQAQRFAEGGRETLADLEQKREAANARYAQAERARDMEGKKEQLGAELAWAHVAGKQTELNDINQKLSNAQAHLRRADHKLEESRVSAHTATRLLGGADSHYSCDTTLPKLLYALLNPTCLTRRSELRLKRKRFD